MAITICTNQLPIKYPTVDTKIVLDEVGVHSSVSIDKYVH